MNSTPLIEPNGPSVLRNLNCVYCGCELTKNTSTREHVIGRGFVPKGTIDGRTWNLIARACRTCNERKSDFEDDISALTMQGSADGELFHQDPRLEQCGARKAKNSVSRSTRKLVMHSWVADIHSFTLMPSATIRFRTVAPPQLDRHRVLQLAHYHITGFFFFLTYNQESQRGGFCEGEFVQLGYSSRPDWGSTSNRSFMEVTCSWEPRLIGFTADGYFRVCIRKHPDTRAWCWALEWNRGYRVIGLMGEPESVREIEMKISPDRMSTLKPTPKEVVSWREETPLSESDDALFRVPRV